jgi:hypothetical protein
VAFGEHVEDGDAVRADEAGEDEGGRHGDEQPDGHPDHDPSQHRHGGPHACPRAGRNTVPHLITAGDRWTEDRRA